MFGKVSDWEIGTMIQRPRTGNIQLRADLRTVARGFLATIFATIMVGVLAGCPAGDELPDVSTRYGITGQWETFENLSPQACSEQGYQFKWSPENGCEINWSKRRTAG